MSIVFVGFPGGSVGNESTCNAGNLGLIPGNAAKHHAEHGTAPPAPQNYLEQDTNSAKVAAGSKDKWL